MPENTSRRRFLKSCATLGTFTILPSYVALGNKSGTGILAPSERVNLAIVGIGNRGGANRSEALRTGLCNIVALCDVDPQGEHTLKARYEHQLAAEPPEPKKPDPDSGEAPETFTLYQKVPLFSDFRRMFDTMGDEIDAVLISTPDHSHFAVAMLAMSLGKHVYVEKPLAHSFGQCERLIDLAARSGVATQMGNQGHSGANYFQFKAWAEAGIIKDVTKITAFMNSARRWHGWGSSVDAYPVAPVPAGMDWDDWINAAPMHPHSAKLHPQNWRGWFAYGSGAFGDWGAHILDTAHRFLNLGLPEKITALKLDGPNPFVFPQASTIRFNFPAREEMPACEVTWYDGIDNKPEVEPELGDLETDEMTGVTARKPVELDRPGKIIYSKDLVFKGDSHASPLQIIPREKFLDMRRSLPSFPQKNSDHYENFLLACKGEEKTRSPFNISGPLTQVFNLGILAQRFGDELCFDRQKKRITNNGMADALLDPSPRKGWEEYYRM